MTWLLGLMLLFQSATKPGSATGAATNSSSVLTLATLNLPTALAQSGTFSASNVGTGVQFADTAGRSGSAIEGRVNTYPGSPYTLTLEMTLPTPASDYGGAGIAIATSTTGNAMWFGYLHYSGFSPTWGLVVYTYSNPGSTGSNLVFSNTGAVSSAPVWLRMHDDGTNITYYVSPDGSTWTTVYTVAKASSYLGSSGFDYLGFVVQPQSAATSVVLQSWTLTHP